TRFTRFAREPPSPARGEGFPRLAVLARVPPSAQKSTAFLLPHLRRRELVVLPPLGRVVFERLAVQFDTELLLGELPVPGVAVGQFDSHFCRQIWRVGLRDVGAVESELHPPRQWASS